jgi:hypothetical protein
MKPDRLRAVWGVAACAKNKRSEPEVGQHTYAAALVCVSRFIAGLFAVAVEATSIGRDK